jgi:uncharacterized protein (DUF488 family)
MVGATTVWTIGHSNHAADAFIGLLRRHSISAVADVRTSPYSAYSIQFNKDQLARHLQTHGVSYVFLGAELGGRPSDATMYDHEGRVRYDLVAESPAYRRGIERVVSGAADLRIALLCGEEDPISCHRRRLVGRTLSELGLAIEHIRGDGSVMTEGEIEVREATEFPERFQLTLVGAPPWRSHHAVRPPSEDSR